MHLLALVSFPPATSSSSVSLSFCSLFSISIFFFFWRRKRRRSCTWPGHRNFKVLGLRPEGNRCFKQETVVVSYSSDKVECHTVRLG